MQRIIAGVCITATDVDVAGVLLMVLRLSTSDETKNLYDRRLVGLPGIR